MESIPGTTNEGTPFPVEPFSFPYFGNFGPPYIATLSLLGFTIQLLVWLFSTLVISNPFIALNASPPYEEFESHVDPFPSSPVKSSSISSSSPGEISNASNYDDKKKNKMKNNKNKNKQISKLPTTTGHVGRN
jgi:hypothetical protein